MIDKKLINSYEVKIKSLERENEALKKQVESDREMLDLTYICFKDVDESWFKNQFRFINARLLINDIAKHLTKKAQELLQEET